MKKILLFVLLLSFIFGCSKKVESVEEKAEIEKRDSVISDYNCVFDWNDSIVPDCGPFTANVFVDGSFVGVWPGNWIDSAYDGREFIESEYSNGFHSKLCFKLTPGEHTYSDRLYCGFSTLFSGDNSLYTGKFIVPDTGFVLVPLY